MNANVKQISASQRAENFAKATRQNYHMLPSQTVNSLGQTVQFTYPKARLLSKTFVKFDFKFKTLADADTYIENPLKVYELVRRISLSLNNGFEPFVVSGKELALINMARINPETITTDKYLMHIDETNKTVSFMLELENTLNQRDASALILLQNESTQVTLSIDIANKTLGANEFESVKITPAYLSYTIPNYPEAFPDLSVIKLTKSRTQHLANGGEHIVKLDVGTIYRKLVLYFTDENGNGKDVVNGNIEVIFNTADTPISIDAEMLKLKNISDFGCTFPEGVYVLDFSGYPGFSGYSGSRDYIDTERLSEFWVRLSTDEACNLTTVQENLSRLR